jgi:hypothetical protein
VGSKLRRLLILHQTLVPVVVALRDGGMNSKMYAACLLYLYYYMMCCLDIHLINQRRSAPAVPDTANENVRTNARMLLENVSMDRVMAETWYYDIFTVSSGCFLQFFYIQQRSSFRICF